GAGVCPPEGRAGRPRRGGRSYSLLGSGKQENAVDLVHLDELDLDALGRRRRQVLADVVGPDRQLTMAAVGEYGKLDARRPAELEQRVDRRADRAPGVQDVVGEDNGAA